VSLDEELREPLPIAFSVEAPASAEAFGAFDVPGLACDAFLLNEGFEPAAGRRARARQVPADRTVVLGLVSSKKPDLESKDELKARIKSASVFVSLNRLALSSQCGFAPTLEGNAVTAADQEAKLRLVAETAEEVWGKSVPLSPSA